MPEEENDDDHDEIYLDFYYGFQYVPENFIPGSAQIVFYGDMIIENEASDLLSDLDSDEFIDLIIDEFGDRYTNTIKNSPELMNAYTVFDCETQPIFTIKEKTKDDQNDSWKLSLVFYITDATHVPWDLFVKDDNE
ncbi:MAG: hypothetical protein OEZ34_04945 [Spirochaetia bacterium]|nr:hypothetical protein [Spirochaetia bacterium]